MFLTKKYISRRKVIRAAGVSMALPLLDAMIPAGTALADSLAKPRLRMGFFYFPHGAITDWWTGVNAWIPEGEGRAFKTSKILQPLEKFRQQMTVVSGLRNRGQEVVGDPHMQAELAWLTGVNSSELQDSAANRSDGGVSIDQIAARHIGQDTSFPSLELATDTVSWGGGHAYRTPGQPLPLEHNPRKVFNRLFGPGHSLEERANILEDTGSVLDRIQAEAQQFQKALGPADQRRLAHYLDSVREVERQIQNMMAEDFSGVDVPDAPAGVPDDFDKHMNIMFDLVAIAYQADLTRIASLRMAAEVSLRAYTNLGISEAFHPLSHHGNRPQSLEKLIAIQTYHSEIFGRFLAKLAATPEADGSSVLDNSILLYGSGMGDSDLHNAQPLPLAVFGRASGRIRGGQHLAYSQDTPHANLLLTLLERAGVSVDSVGDSTGELAEV